MPVIGNDNHPETTAAAYLQGKGSKWLTGYMAQFIVLLNGFILTFTIFATLYVFIEQNVDANFVKITTETQEHFEGRFGNLEKGLQSAASTVSFSGKITPDEIIDVFGTGFSYGNSFEQIYWLEWTGADQYTSRKLMIDQNGDVPRDHVDTSPIHKYVIKSLKENPLKGMVLYGDEADFPNLAGEGDSNLVMAMPVKRTDGRTDIVYGITSIRHIMAPTFLNFRQTIQELDIIIGSGDSVFHYKKPGAVNENSYNSIRKGFYLNLANKPVRVSYRMDLDNREELLRRIPLLVAIFGFTLTIIGALYVRSNQKQSWRLAMMNIELGQKNTDLNYEVTEREKLNMALRQQERENRAIIDAVSDIIFEVSPDGRILFLNETWRKISGFSPDHSIGKNLFDLLYAQDQQEQRSNLIQLVKGQKQAYRAFTRLRTSNGTFRAVELAVSMLRQDENKELRVVGTITDVEERRRTERALSEAEKKYRAIVENAATGFYQVTPEGQYLSVNPAMAKILGYESAEEILREVENVTSEIYCSGRERERQLREALRNGSTHAECQIRRRDGSMIWVHENLRAVKDEHEELIFFEGSLEDVTQRKTTEIALREAMTESNLANRAKSEFLANMSHELRTPLNAIIGFSDIIRNQAFGNVGREEYIDYARDINESGKHLLQVINDILDVSRIEAGDRQLNEGIVDVAKIVSSSIDILASKIESNKITLTNLVGSNTAKLVGESHAVKQMVLNLLSNAVKFTPSGGRVSIHADVDDYGQMLLSITDTGIGLTDEEVEKALSPFGQINAGLNKTESGTGLGLTLVQSLISLHGGSFELFSQKGIGTTATLIFPAKRVSQSGARQPETV